MSVKDRDSLRFQPDLLIPAPLPGQDRVLPVTKPARSKAPAAPAVIDDKPLKPPSQGPRASKPKAAPSGPEASPKGHRERLRDRARKSLDTLPDYELLELFLFRSIPQRDVKPLAKALLSQYGSLAAIVAASDESLQSVSVLDRAGKRLAIGPETALDLRALQEITQRITLNEVKKRSIITSWSALLTYLRTRLAHEKREQFRVLFLDRKNQLLQDEMLHQGTVDHAPVYPREVMRRALELSASALILVHNHPSGDPTPSQADIDMTRALIEAANTLKISIHDHIVVGANGVASFKALGLI